MKRGKINKEKEGITVRFSIRLPRELHTWLKARSSSLKEERISMNDIIIEAIEEYILEE